MKPTFSVTVDGMSATFTDTYKDPTSRIWLIDSGDGHMLYWDAPDQTVITHVYAKPGTYQTKALTKNKEMSDVMPVTIGGVTPPGPGPVPVPSLWQRFIYWLKGVLGWK